MDHVTVDTRPVSMLVVPSCFRFLPVVHLCAVSFAGRLRNSKERREGFSNSVLRYFTTLGQIDLR